MQKKELVESVGKYIDKYYILANDDIRLDKEMKDVFQKIADFCQKRKKEKKAIDNNEIMEYEIDESAVSEFDESDIKKTKVFHTMSGTMSPNRKIDDLINQMDETFSQKLLRMISERGMTDSEVYTKAYIDRRHFSKIRKDEFYSPNKKTVLAFVIALELSLDEAKDLLACAGYALSRSSKADIIIAYFLQNKIYDMFEINDILDAYGQPTF